MSNVIRKIVGVITLAGFSLFIGCEDTITSPTENISTDVLSFDMRLPVDDNGYYHLELGQSWQTTHRISGTAYINESPVEMLRVQWESDLMWYLGDTLGYIVNRNFDDNGMYVSIDTSYITGFNGMEVPTINCCSYSNSDGEVNTMIAPVQTMVGDTMTIRMYFWNNEYEIVDEVFYIVLN